MKLYLPVFLVVLALIGVGCTIQFESPPDYSDYPPEVPSEEYPPPIPEEEYPPVKQNSNFDARIAAARSITSFTSKDRALSAIAIDAANELEIEPTLRALSMMTSFTTKDDTAEKCVMPFINSNMIAEAKSIADKITSFTVKDRVLSRIAQGPVGN